jgi:hypothetical protein
MPKEGYVVTDSDGIYSVDSYWTKSHSREAGVNTGMKIANMCAMLTSLPNDAEILRPGLTNLLAELTKGLNSLKSEDRLNGWSACATELCKLMGITDGEGIKNVEMDMEKLKEAIRIIDDSEQQ